MVQPSCAVTTCDRASRTRGWCKLHYRRWQRHGDPEKVILGAPAKGLECSKPECDQPAFARTWCRSHYNQWYGAQNHRSIYLAGKFGITEQQADELFAAQDHRCAICQREVERLVIDHCHASGQIRAALCHNCNVALGLVRDDPTILTAMVSYLDKHRADAMIPAC